jgi:tetratricopeptide (TPR) repeat protein
MHDLVRLYAAEQAAGVDTSTAVHRLVDFYMQTLRGCTALLDLDPPQAEYPDPLDGCRPLPIADAKSALAWFATEQDNLRAAQEMSAELGWHEHVWLMAWCRKDVHYRLGLLQEERASWQLALAAAEHLARKPLVITAHRLLGLALTHAEAGETAGALRHLRQALDLAEQTGDLAELSRVHRGLSVVYGNEGDYETALRHAVRHYEIFAELGDTFRGSRALNAVGWFRAVVGDLDGARADCEAALEQQQKGDDRDGMAATLDSLGFIAHRLGDSHQALDYFHQALTVFRDLDSRYQEADTLLNIGDVHRDLGAPAQARRFWREALALYRSQHRAATVEQVEQRLRDSAGADRR